MATTVIDCKRKLMKEIEGLNYVEIQEILDFARFIKVKERIDPEQAYFWTKKWQKMEMEAENDKKEGRVIGNGTVDDLLKKLKK